MSKIDSKFKAEIRKMSCSNFKAVLAKNIIESLTQGNNNTLTFLNIIHEDLIGSKLGEIYFLDCSMCLLEAIN